jgi:deoxycytidylate deaminase
VPSPDLTDDENYMDLCILIMRTSKCLQGSMGCLIVNPLAPPTTDDADETATLPPTRARFVDSVICASVNSPLYNKNCSDVHAEVNALCHCAMHGKPTLGSTAYITMPPCKNCFASLIKSGVKRIVARHLPLQAIVDICQIEGIEVVEVIDNEEREKRRLKLIDDSGRGTVQGAGLIEARKARKEMEAEYKGRKRREKRQKLEDETLRIAQTKLKLDKQDEEDQEREAAANVK